MGRGGATAEREAGLRGGSESKGRGFGRKGAGPRVEVGYAMVGNEWEGAGLQLSKRRGFGAEVSQRGGASIGSGIKGAWFQVEGGGAKGGSGVGVC